ncbi:hypothetical protein pipiens_008810 [Culex pipiens pipiens]|uniref:Ion transport domain-containing protein n=1 Tax=Culex pipiens pipiens TaxID=38569 RepID=A0ABD1DI32_CULPP
MPLISNSPEQTPTTKPVTPESTQSDWKPLRFPRWMNPFYLLHMLIPPAIIFLAALSLRHNNRTALAGVILLSGIDNIIHFKMLPWTTLSASIIMLETVSRSLLKILLSYLVLLLSFGVSFHVLLSDNGDSSGNETCGNSFDSFSRLEGSMVKSLVMMIGEFNAQDIPFSKHQYSYLMFLFFVFLVTMVIMNLVNGLAVSDVTELRHNAELDTMASWIKLLHRFENVYSLSFSSFFNRYEPKVIIKTDKDNMIQLIKVKDPKTVGEVRVSMTSNGQQQTKKKAKPIAGTISLRIFPVLKFCHSLHPDVCYALKEIAAENLLQEDAPEYKWDKRAKHEFTCVPVL